MKVRALNISLVPRMKDMDFEEFYKKKFSFLDIEVGCGVGMHPLEYAEANPKRLLVALEHTKEKFNKFKNSFNRKKPPLLNLYPVHANAISWVVSQIRPLQVDRYFFLYPNPNPKKKDLSKRFHASPFMHYVIESLKPGGEIFLATNELFYATEARDYFTNYWGLDVWSEKEITIKSDPDFKPRTHFEKKYFERGQVLYDFCFYKKKQGK